MDSLLKAVRTRLINDTTLTAIVSASDIHISYRAIDTNYPCVVFGIKAGTSETQISGVSRATLIINVYSKVSKQQLWTIYNRIKALLHNQERGITNAGIVVHAVYESDISDDKYDKDGDVWQISAEYNMLYGVSGLAITTGANGAIYADLSAVSANIQKEVARFRGQVDLEVAFEHEIRFSQERFGRSMYYKSGFARLTIAEVMFKASILDLLWNVNTSINGRLNDGNTSATIYQLSQNSYPAYLQVLFQMIKTDDGRKLEIESSRAVCNNLVVPFSKNDFSVFNCEWVLLGDDNDNIVKVAVEN